MVFASHVVVYALVQADRDGPNGPSVLHVVKVCVVKS